MGLMEDYFNFKSHAEVEREHQNYENRMFPLGNAQKELIAQRVSTLFNNRKLTDSDLMFNFLVLKQVMLNDDETKKEKEYYKWYETVTSKSLSDEEKGLMLALVKADLECADLSKYKTAEEIREDVKNIILLKPEKKSIFSFLKVK